MNHRIPIMMRTIILCVLVLLLAAPHTPAQAAEGDKGIATVSLARLQANYGELRAREQNLSHWLEERRARYNELANYVFLSQKDFEAALEIIQKPRPLSDEDRQQLAELRTVSDEREQRFAELRAKPDRTPQETAEFNTLQETYEARAGTLQTMQQEIVQELSQRRDREIEGLMERVQDAIVETAEELGYNIVLDADAVFLGGEDITEAVLRKLNFGTEAPTEEPAVEETTEEPADAEDAGDDAAGGAQDGGDEGDG